MEVISPVFSDQVEQVIKNLDEIVKESGNSLNDIVKITCRKFQLHSNISLYKLLGLSNPGL